MNITLRQLGKLESCAATLDAAFDAKNPCAMRCVALVREVLDEIVSAPETALNLTLTLILLCKTAILPPPKPARNLAKSSPTAKSCSTKAAAPGISLI